MEKKDIADNIIGKGLQHKYFKMIVGMVVVIMAVFSLGVYGVVHIVLSSAQLGRYAESIIKDTLFWIDWLIGVVGLMSIILTGGLCLGVSKKIAAPLCKMEEIIKKEIIKETGNTDTAREKDLNALVQELSHIISS